MVGDRLYVMGWSGGQDALLCLDAATGREVWRQTYPAKPYGRHATGDEGWYKGVSSTPEFDPASGLLFTLSLRREPRRLIHDCAQHVVPQRKRRRRVPTADSSRCIRRVGR